MKRWLSIFVALACAGGAVAQTYPARPIRLIVPWPPGQATDLAARLVAEKLSQSIGQPVVVDNRAGAGGSIGTDAVAKAAPDGYTLLAASSGPISISPLLQKVPFDVDKELAPVNLIARAPFVLVAHPGLPAANAKELVALVRANPDKYSFSSSGTGATAHLFSELFNTRAQLKAVHVPYKGSAPALTDVMSGQIAYTIETLAATGPHIKSGKLKALGVSTAQRSAALPDVPTIAEAAGLPGYDMAAWIGYMAPAGTPREIVARLAAETQKALQGADTRERFVALGLEPATRGAEEFGRFLAEERARYADIIKSANIKVE
jgi:tripartite-type tricarboxylate transporter receptor subunit TctC